MAKNITFVINPVPPKEYSRGKDKDGLSREDRVRIENIKDELSNPINPYAKEVWDE